MAFTPLPALRPREWRATICVRVCRKWEYRGGTDDGPIQHVDLVLVDEQVCLSSCYIPIWLWRNFVPFTLMDIYTYSS